MRDVAENAAHWRTRAYVIAEDNTRAWSGKAEGEQETILHDASALLFEDFGGLAVVLANPNWRSDFTSSAGQNKESENLACLKATVERIPRRCPISPGEQEQRSTRPFELAPQERNSMDHDDPLAAALRYAERGWKIFPVPWGTKKSHKSAEHSGGLKWGMTSDPAEIRRDFKRWPKAGVGLPTGVENGFFVVEADTPKGHKIDGLAGLKALEDEHGPLPDTLMAESPSGSLHRYYKLPGGDQDQELGIRNRAGRRRAR